MSEENSLHKIALMMASQVTTENPLTIAHRMYQTVNPLAMQSIVKDAKTFVSKENNRNGKEVDVFMTLGGETNYEKMFDGMIGAFLFLLDYIDIAADIKKLDKKDVEITKKVLRTIDIPLRADEGSSCRHFSQLIQSFLQWLTSGFTQGKIEGKVRNNYEITRLLRATALEQFPAIPPTVYHIDKVKTNNPFKLAEKLQNNFHFTNYMSKISVELNEPRFVVAAGGSPIVFQSGHPLTNMYIGAEKDGEVEWLGIFTDSEEFNRICMENGVSMKEVKRYMMENNMETHMANLKKGKHPIAKFIESQALAKMMFEQKVKSYNTEGELTDKEEIEKLLSQ